jgi:hypothetical protein
LDWYDCCDMMLAVYTVLVCYQCKRNLVMMSTNTWPYDVSHKPKSGSWIYVTLVYCSRCADEGMSAYVGLRIPMRESNVTQQALDVIESLDECANMPVIMHTAKGTDVNTYSGLKVRGDWDELYLVVEHMNAVMSGMWGAYVLSSVVEGLVTLPCRGFLMDGHAVSMKFLLYPTRMVVNNIMFCPTCWRNVMFTGTCSVMDLKDAELRGNYLNLIMYTCCMRCTRLADGDEHDQAHVLDSLQENEIKLAGMVAYAARVLGNDVYIYKDVNNDNTKVVSAHAMVQRLMFSTMGSSLIDGEKGPMHDDFF